MIYIKSGISQRRLEQRLNADVVRRRQFTHSQKQLKREPILLVVFVSGF